MPPKVEKIVTNQKIALLDAKDKAYKFSVGKGLYLLVKPNSAKYWRIIYGFKGLPFQLAVNSKSIAFLIALLAGLSVASLLLNNLLWLFYSEDSSMTFLLVSVSVLVGIVLGIGGYKKIVPVLTLKFSKAY